MEQKTFPFTGAMVVSLAVSVGLAAWFFSSSIGLADDPSADEKPASVPSH
jgi:hypothetical protein